MKNKNKHINKISASTIAKTAVMAAIIAALSQIAIPLPSGVPVTMQVFAIAFVGYLFGWLGVVSVAVYLSVGAIGAPVFANFKGGFAVFAGPTGGFLWGFLLMAFFCALGKNRKIWLNILFGLMGFACCHLLGIVQFAAFTDSTLKSAFVLVSLPYIIKDILSVVAAYFLAVACSKGLTKAGIKNDYALFKRKLN
jgi:biotin transport system substrate-specific component